VRRLLADDWRERPAMASDAASDLVPILSVPNAVAPILHASTTRHVVRRVASDRPRPRAPRVLAEPVPDVPVELPERRRWPRGWIGRPRAEHLVARHEEVRGRDREQRQLWARFACVVARGGTEIWNLEGPSGVGKATLRDWFAQRAAELGVAHRVDVTRSLREALVRNFGDLRAWSTASTTTEAVRAGWQGQRPWVVTGALSAEDAAALRTRGPATIVLGDRALPEPDLALVLGPIEPDAMEQLLTDRASLHPRATSQLVLSSGGVPGAALATLHDWLRGPRWSTDGGQHEPMWQDLPPPVLPERSTDPVLAALHDRVASFSEAHPAVDPSEIDDLRMLGPTHLGRTVSVWARRWLAWPALASDERARLELLAARHGRLRPPLIAVAERYTRHADLRIRFEALSCLMASSSAMNDVETTRAALDEMRTLAPEVSLTARLVVAYGEIMYPSDGSVDRSLEQAAWIADVTPTTLGEGWWHCLACERLAEAARFLGRWDDALRWIDLARSDEQRELVPGTLGTGMAYGLVLRGMGRLEEAARVLEELGQRQLATANGGAGDTLECLADVERQLGRLESAETHLLQSIECRHGTELVSTADTAMALLRLDQGREHEVRAILPRLRSYLDKPLTGATVRLMSALVQIRSGDEHAALTEVAPVSGLSRYDRNRGNMA
ncbi:MAG: tetratricopeptide repeat protein, partial [Myxococcota bacterium]